MSCYVNATNERLYGAVENDYGQVVTLNSSHRISFRSLRVTERAIRSERKDKTGSRTQLASHPAIRKDNRFDLACYFSARDAGSPLDGMAQLVSAVLGGQQRESNALVVSSAVGTPQVLTFSAPHDLVVGQALRFGGELRFVRTVLSSTSVELSAPFVTGMSSGSVLGKAVTMFPGDKPRSFTLGNYWNPGATLDRLLAGCVANEMQVTLNSDFHGAVFRGTSREVLPASSFTAGSAGLGSFPSEPTGAPRDIRLVPGHVGRLHIGGAEFFLLDLSVRLVNNTDTTTREFGLPVSACYSADKRDVTVQFQLYANDSTSVTQLHTLARTRTETSISIQMGDTPGQLVGIHIPRFIPEFPDLRDQDSRVVMSYPASVGVGVSNDEISIAFA